jgi:hypothetical protein
VRTSPVTKILFCLCFLTFAKLSAADFTSKEKYPDLVVFGVGAFDFHRDCRVAQLSFEYRIGLSKFRIAQAIMGALVPFNGSLYLYGGFGLDIFLGRHVVITPSFCPGVYFQGKGKNLGYPLEFRSSVEIAYVFTNRSRIGVQGYHISNGSMAGKNPGEESLLLFYALHL